MAAHRADEHHRAVVRVRARHWFWRRLLARSHARHAAVAVVHGILPRPGCGRVECVSRAEAVELQCGTLRGFQKFDGFHRFQRLVRVLERIVRDAAVACLVIAVLFAVIRRDVMAGVSVLGGGLLIGISYWAIKGTVDALIGRRTASFAHGGEAAAAAESGARPRRWPLVKFFTRHGMLALAAYGMMVRLHLDP